MTYFDGPKPISPQEAIGKGKLSQQEIAIIKGKVNKKLEGYREGYITINWQELNIREIGQASEIAKIYQDIGWTVHVEPQDQRNEGEFIQFSHP